MDTLLLTGEELKRLLHILSEFSLACNEIEREIDEKILYKLIEADWKRIKLEKIQGE